MPTSSDNLRAAQSPVLATGLLRTLDLTTADASISLAAGAYDLVNASGDVAVVSLTEATTSLPPTSGAAGATGACVIPAGGVVSIALDATTTLHARLLTGTGALYLHRKAVA